MKRVRKKSPSEKRPVMTINIYSWATPVVGIVMLVIGLFGGYYGGQPASKDISEQAVPQLNEPSPTAAVAANADNMDSLAAQIRHFKGDQDAPVTLVEFGDFQ